MPKLAGPTKWRKFAVKDNANSRPCADIYHWVLEEGAFSKLHSPQIECPWEIMCKEREGERREGKKWREGERVVGLGSAHIIHFNLPLSQVLFSSFLTPKLPLISCTALTLFSTLMTLLTGHSEGGVNMHLRQWPPHGPRPDQRPWWSASKGGRENKIWKS